MTLHWTRLALEDLDHAYQYIVKQNPAAACRVIERIEAGLRALSNHPHIGRAGRVAGTLELVVAGTPFVIPYRIKQQRIELLAVIHAAHRWPDSFSVHDHAEHEASFTAAYQRVLIHRNKPLEKPTDPIKSKS
jgi:toxin ParE1/3/4